MASYTEFAVRVYAPTELEEELVVLPNFSGVCLVGVLNVFAATSGRLPQHRLAEGEPLAGVGLLAHQVVAFGGEAQRQHVVGEVCGFVPGWCERDVAADVVLV